MNYSECNNMVNVHICVVYAILIILIMKNIDDDTSDSVDNCNNVHFKGDNAIKGSEIFIILIKQYG